MKLQTQFTVPKKQVRSNDYGKKLEVLDKTLNKECLVYPTQEDCLVCCD